MYIGRYLGPGLFSLLADIAEDICGDGSTEVLFCFILFVCLIIYIARGYYRETWLYKRIMGDKAKPCLYDGRGNRIRNPDGTPIEPQEENAEPEAPKEGETLAGEQGEKTKQ